MTTQIKYFVITAAITTLLTFTTPVRAWNDSGHMTIALLSWRQLDDAQKQTIGNLLREHPHYKLFLSADVPEGVSVDEWAFMRASFWPDFVRPSWRGDPKFKPPAITQYHRGNWHYINIPYFPKVKTDKGLPTTNPTTAPAAEVDNVVSQLHANTAVFADESAAPADRAVALSWILHLGGDLHQPLHTCTMYTPDYPEGDRGGNSISIRTNGYVARLHSYWDDLLGTSDAYPAIDHLVRSISSDPTCDPKLDPTFDADKTIMNWAQTSHEFAVALVYLNGRLQYASSDDFDKNRITADQVPALPASYGHNAREFARTRAAVAGSRLTTLIKSALATD